MPALQPETRSDLQRVSLSMFWEYLLWMTVPMLGLYLASHDSDAAASAFGIGIQMSETLLVVFRILAMGIVVIVTRQVAAQRMVQAHDMSFAMLGASTWLGGLVALYLVLGTPWTLAALNTPEEIWWSTALFMWWLAPAMWLEAYCVTLTAILRAHMRSHETNGVIVLMHGSHIALSFLFMRGWGSWEGWGVAGFAVAMVVSRLLTLVLHLWIWQRVLHMRVQWGHWWKLPVTQLGPVFRIGLPGAAYEMTYRIAFMVAMSVVAAQGVAAIAAHAYTLQILKFVLLTSFSIGRATEVLVGREVGVGNLREADRLVRRTVQWGLLVSGTLIVLVALSADWILQVFTRDPDIMRVAGHLLWMAVLLELTRVFNLIVVSAQRAAGDIHFPAAVGMVSIVLLLGAGSVWLGQWLGIYGVWLALVLDEGVRGILAWWRWRQLGWLPHARDAVRSVRDTA